MKRNLPFRYLSAHYLKQRRLFDRNFDWKITGKWMFYSSLVGVLGAFAAVFFTNLVELISGGALLQLVGYAPPLPGNEADPGAVFNLGNSLSLRAPWLLLIIPTVGGLVSGWLVLRFAPEAEGHGTDAVIKAYHQNQGEVRPRVAIIKTLASSITIGTGGSAGKEGPIAQIASAIGSWVGQRLDLPTSERRMLLIAGVAAGIGSIFQSPLGGAFFAVEVMYREDIESDGIMPAMIAAITGYSVYSMIEGSSTVFTTPKFEFLSAVELLPLILFAIVCAVVGIYFTKIFYGIRSLFSNNLTIPTVLKPALGGFLLGAIAFFFPAVLGSSYGWLQQAINGNLPLYFMLTLVVTKMIATSLTIGSGGSGGVFAPSLVIGGMLGGIFGTFLQEVLPNLVNQPEAYVLIGMATFFAAVANVPIAMTIMISEMTGSYSLLVPLIFSGVISHLLAKKWSLYTQQVRNHNESPAHRFELVPELLGEIQVGAIVKHPVYFHTLDPDHTLEEIESVFARTREVVLPVVKSEPSFTGREEYCGLVLLESIQPYFKSGEKVREAISAKNLMVPFAAVRLTDSLNTVHEVLEQFEYPEIPVLDSESAIVGFIRPGQVISEYQRAMLRKNQFTS
jgi:chloride channel protein, CIC family